MNDANSSGEHTAEHKAAERVVSLPPVGSHSKDEEAVFRLALAGESEAMWRLRHQMQILGPHLRGALVEAERGLGGTAIARELHRLSEFAALPLWTAEAQDGSAQDRLRRYERQTVLVHGLPGASPHVQRWWMNQIKACRREGLAMQWLVLIEQPLKQLVQSEALLPEVARALPPVVVRVPPVRERQADVVPLALRVLRSLGTGPDCTLPDGAVDILQAHAWPGNLLELVQSMGQWYAEASHSAASLAALLQPKRVESPSEENAAPLDEPILLQAVIDRHLLRTMRRCGGNKLRAAEMLGISRSTLYRMLDAIAGHEYGAAQRC